MLSTLPTHKEIQEFQFKLVTQLRLFPSEQSIKLVNPINLIATASKYGLIFAGIPSGITCIQTNSIVNIQNQRSNNRGYIISFPRRDLKLGFLPSHIAISCDNELLAATISVDGCLVLLIYDVTSFGTTKIKTKHEMRMSNIPGVIVTDLQWNPGVANIIGIVLSDGSAIVYELKDGTTSISSIPPNAQASCLCWSPKGKQIVIGAKNGSLTQYKPDLKAVKSYAPPQIVNQPEVVSVQWLSNYQFIAAYKDRNNSSTKPVVVVVNVPKGAPASFVNYEDVCFGFGTSRPEHYFIHQQLWGVIILGTSNGTEVVVLGQNGDSWEQWMQDESNRAQLPVSEDYQDVYLTGMAIDYSPQAPIPVGENNFINPMPFLLIYSQEGVLCIYHVINLLPNSAVVCQAPQPLPDQSGMHLFTDIQNVQPEANKQVQEAQVLNSLGQNKSSEAELSKQVTQFKLPSFGSDLSSQPNKEKVIAPFSSQSPFSTLNMQKPSQPLITTTSHGNMSALGNFGLMAQHSGTPSTLVAPKFSSSSPLIPQQSPATSALTFLLPTPSSQVTSPQTNSSMSILTQQPPPNSRGLTSFQLSSSSNSAVPPFTMTSSGETLIGSPAIAKPALLMTPLQVNSSQLNLQGISMSPLQANSSQISTQGISIPSLQANTSQLSSQGISISTCKPPVDKITLNKEMTNKDTSNIQPNNLTEVKETEIPQLNQAVTKIEEEKEQPVIEVDFIGAIKEELSNFNVEMSDFEQLKNSLNFSVGKEQINYLVAKINDLKIFEKDVKETTQAQEGEVSNLVTNVVEMFSWLENVKSKQKQINNPRYMDLIESQDLDPVTKKHINHVEQYIYYLDTQIKQANLQLDALWAQHKGKPVKSFEIPNLEAIYQTIIAENYILAAQKVRITELEVRLKEKLKTFSRKIPQLSDFSSSSSKSSSDIELDVLADKLLLSKLTRHDEMESNSLKDNADKFMTMNRTQKYLGPKKESLLHKWHKTHVVINSKSPKRENVRLDLTKYSKVVTTSSPSRSVSQDVSGSEKKSSRMPRSILTITCQPSISPQVSCESELLTKHEEPTITNNAPFPSFITKSELNNSTEILSHSLPNNEVIIKAKTDSEMKSTQNSNAQVAFSGMNHVHSSFRNNLSAWDTKSFSQNDVPYSPQDESITKHSAGETNVTNQYLFKTGSSNTNHDLNSKSFQSPFNYETNYSFKAPPALTSLAYSSPSENSSVKVSEPSTALSETLDSSISSNVAESKENCKKDNTGAIAESRKTGSEESNKLGNGGTSNSNSITEKPLSTSDNIFGTSSSVPSTMPAFNFSKNSVFSNISATSSSGATGLKTTTLFGAPLATSTTTSIASTSIFAGKPITSLSPQFVNPVSTSASTTITPLLTSSSPISKPAVTSSSPILASTTTFFTKPSTMKSLFGNVQISGTNVTNSATLFKSSSSPLGTSIFATSQPQVTTASLTKAETVTTNAITTSPISVSIPAVAVGSTTASNVISTTPGSLPFSNTPVTTTLETSATTSTSNFVVSTTPVVTPSIPSVNIPSTVSEKETTIVATSFGITSTASSVFGAKTSAQTVPSFDTTIASPTAASKTFGNTVTTVGTSAESSSIFGSPVSKPSMFGNQSTSPSFSTTSTTTTSSIFPTTTTFVFGSPSAKTTTASIFGTPPSTFGPSTTSASVFGTASALASTSFFGTPTTTSVFGTPQAPSIFSPPASTSASSFFGQSVCSPTSTVTNAFSNVSFGQKTTPTTTSANVFGGNRSSFETKPLFGMSGGGLFGQTNSSPGPFGLSGGSLFGNATTFGSPQQTTNLFQSPAGSGGTLFNSSNAGGGGSFSAGNQSVAQSGFGALPNFQSGPKPFGANSSPVFGSQTSFGAAPTFGGSATFGSPNKVFGSPSSTGTVGFGSPTQQSSTFENLAGQNTLTFGNLAQGQQQQGFNSNSTFGVGSPQPTTFPATSSFGGSSFSNWR